MEEKITLVPSNAVQKEKKEYKRKGFYSKKNDPKQQGEKQYVQKDSNKGSNQGHHNNKHYHNNHHNHHHKGHKNHNNYNQQYYQPQYQKQHARYQQSYNNSPQFEEGINYDDYQFMFDFPRATDYSSTESILKVFPHLQNINNREVNYESQKDMKLFIMRSNCEDDVHKGIKYGIWTSTPKSNEFLNNLYEECTPKGIPIYLFFSVVRSGQFIAVGQLTSKLIMKNFQYWWEQDKWVNHFQVKWLMIKDIPFKFFTHLRMKDDLTVTRARDCTNVPFHSAKEMLKIYRDFNEESNIFGAFHFMDIREDMLRQYKYQVQMYQNMYYPEQQAYQSMGNKQIQKTQQETNANKKTSPGMGPTSFKYNSFPTQNISPVMKPISPLMKPLSPHSKPLERVSTSDLETLVDEFETRIRFYKDQIQKLGNEAKELGNLTNKSDNSAKALSDLAQKEKEIMEGLDVLDLKQDAVQKLSLEEQHKNDFEKLKKRFSILKDELTRLKADLKLGSDNLSQLNQKFNTDLEI